MPSVVRAGRGSLTLDVEALKTTRGDGGVDVEHDATAFRFTGYAAFCCGLKTKRWPAAPSTRASRRRVRVVRPGMTA
jgi:hypothetical protein